MSFTQWVSIGRDIIVSLAAVGTFGLAFYGIRSWKREFHGKTKYRLASQLLHTTYKLKEAVVDFRSPYIRKEEFSQWYFLMDDEHKELPENKARSLRELYDKRLVQVYEAARELSEVELETRTHYFRDIDVLLALDPFLEIPGRLKLALATYVENIRSDYTEIDQDSDAWEQVLEIMDSSKGYNYEATSIDDMGENKLDEEMRKNIEKLENALSKYLK